MDLKKVSDSSFLYEPDMWGPYRNTFRSNQRGIEEEIRMSRKHT